MAEFVELNLEKLLPVFERLKKQELMTTFEVTEFIKRCRYYEYKISKLVRFFFSGIEAYFFNLFKKLYFINFE